MRKELIVGGIVVIVIAGYFLFPTIKDVVTNIPTPTPEDSIDTSDWKTYTNEEYGFSFRYPEDWFIRDIVDDSRGFELGVSYNPDNSECHIICGDVVVIHVNGSNHKSSPLFNYANGASEFFDLLSSQELGKSLIVPATEEYAFPEITVEKITDFENYSKITVLHRSSEQSRIGDIDKEKQYLFLDGQLYVMTNLIGAHNDKFDIGESIVNTFELKK